MPSVQCRYCGGSHPSWECKQKEPAPVVIDVADARRTPAERRALADEPEPRESEGRFAKMSASERNRVPWQQPEGVCPSCDKRRAANARRMAGYRERN